MTALPRPRRLLIVGGIVADIRMDVPRLPSRGGDATASSASVSAGGSFNILTAAARNGMACAFAGRHGTGPFGSVIRTDLLREGIDVLSSPSSEGDNGFCLVMVEPDGERTFVTSPGVEAALGTRRLPLLVPGDVAFVSGYDLRYPALGPAIAEWSARLPDDALLVVDPGPVVGEVPADTLRPVLSRCRILTMNRREAMLFGGSREFERVATLARARLAAGALVIVRDGANGCILAGEDEGRVIRIPAPVVRAVDSTGAGDTHTGVFIAALAAGLDPLGAARRANAAAAISVTRRGSATAPTGAELEAFLERARAMHLMP